MEEFSYAPNASPWSTFIQIHVEIRRICFVMALVPFHLCSVLLFVLFQWERFLLLMFLPSHILWFCPLVRKMRKPIWNERRSVPSALSGSSCRGGWRHVQVCSTGFLSGFLLLLWRTSTAVRWGHCLVGRGTLSLPSSPHFTPQAEGP